MVSGVKIRQPAVAGSFYPREKSFLLALLGKFFRQTKKIPLEGKIKALILPHAGSAYSGQTAAWGYRQLPEQISSPHFVLIGPSHFAYFPGLIFSSFSFWETPLGKVSHQRPPKNSKWTFFDEPFFPEHSLEVQLPFLQFLYSNFSFSGFLTGTFSPKEREKTAEDLLQFFPSSFFLISSDLSHFLPQKEAEEKDKKTLQAILNLDQDYLQKEENTACGLEGILILLKMAQRKNWRGRVIYYDTSATFAKEKNQVVGYAAVIFYS